MFLKRPLEDVYELSASQETARLKAPPLRDHVTQTDLYLAMYVTPDTLHDSRGYITLINSKLHLTSFMRPADTDIGMKLLKPFILLRS